VISVLVVVADKASRRSVSSALRFAQYRVEAVSELSRAAPALRRRRPDVLIVDLAGERGPDVVEELRALTEVPIVVVAASDDPWDKISALDAGADDYLAKPFNIEELLARLRVALRRSMQPAPHATPPISTPDFTVYVDDRRWVRRDGTEVGLTPTEWRVVELLVRRAGHLVSQAELLRAVWGPKAADKTHYLRVQMAAIRRKVEPDPARPRYFITAPGLGLRFDAPVADALPSF
jgi:two-component system, OmpR family, KDP operon response regulator KdpE